MAKVLDAVKLPDEVASGRSPESLRKSRAAHRRWDIAHANAERRAAGGVR